MLQKENIGFLYFTGGMGEKRRQEARDAFADKPEIKVMVSQSLLLDTIIVWNA